MNSIFTTFGYRFLENVYGPRKQYPPLKGSLPPTWARVPALQTGHSSPSFFPHCAIFPQRAWVWQTRTNAYGNCMGVRSGQNNDCEIQAQRDKYFKSTMLWNNETFLYTNAKEEELIMIQKRLPESRIAIMMGIWMPKWALTTHCSGKHSLEDSNQPFRHWWNIVWAQSLPQDQLSFNWAIRSTMNMMIACPRLHVTTASPCGIRKASTKV